MRDRKFIPIVRRQRLSDGSILQKLVGKETIKVDVNVTKDTINGVKVIAGMITGGILFHAILRRS